MQVYVPRLESVGLDGLETQGLSQKVVVMRDGAWVFLYNEVERSPSFLQKRLPAGQAGMKDPGVYIEKKDF